MGSAVTQASEQSPPQSGEAAVLPVAIGVIDCYPITLRGLQSIFDAVPDMHVVAMHTSPDMMDPAATDVVVMDAYISGDRPCLAVIERFAAQTKVIVSSHRWTPELAGCSDAGASAFIPKASPPERFVDTVRMVVEGKSVPMSAAAMPTGGRLSPRERTVLAHISQGLTHDQTARRLGISRHTVDTYVKRARAKMKFGNKAELTRSMLLSSIRGVNP